MALNNKGRPRTNDPKMPLTGVRIEQSTLIQLEVLSDELNMSKNELIRSALRFFCQDKKQIISNIISHNMRAKHTNKASDKATHKIKND